MLMVDTVQIMIPLFSTYCKQMSKTKWEIIGEVTDYGLVASSRYVKKSDTGDTVAMNLYHPYESIPTSHTGIAFKFMHSANNCLPHVILNCSIAKLLQGHNVFGNTDMITGVLHMIGLFSEAYPELMQYLDLQNAQISRFDITLPMQTSTRHMAEKVREHLRFCDWGRYRNLLVRNEKLEYNTIYFGSPNTKVGGFKIYCKGVELDGVIKDLEKKAKKGCISSLYKLNNVYTDDVRNFADSSLRLEVTVKKRMIKEQSLPTNLWEFLRYQFENQGIYEHLFTYKTHHFFDALKGLSMDTDDTRLYELLIDKLTTITATGRTSTAKAESAYSFYKRIKDDGFYVTKNRMNIRTFQRNVKALVDAGVSRSYLQNLAKESKSTNVLEIIRFDMNGSLPITYTPPQTPFIRNFDKYFSKQGV